MEKVKVNEATCDSSGRVFMAGAKRYYCTHCNKYYHVCSSCGIEAKCRFCGIPLKRRTEPQFIRPTKRRELQRA